MARKKERIDWTAPDEDGWMRPMWVAYGYERSSAMWRLSVAEDYRWRWYEWWDTLTPERRAAYEAKYPVPEDSDWVGFYEEANKPNEP